MNGNRALLDSNVLIFMSKGLLDLKLASIHTRMLQSLVIKLGEEFKMQGINYVTNEDGKRVAVMIDLKKHGELWEDFYDGLTAKKRKGEPRESLDAVRNLLKRKGKLNG